MTYLLASWRGVRVLWLLVVAVVLTAGSAGLMRAGLRAAWWPALVRWWYGRLCQALGLHIECHGRCAGPGLLVANHISWLDIPVLGAQGPLVFLSKAEVRTWPVVGWLAARTGTLFIARGEHQAGALAPRIGALIHGPAPAQTREQTPAQLTADEVAAAGRDQPPPAQRAVVIFPEGTTGDGTTLHRFHPRLFAVAQQPGIRVQPVAVRYGTNAAPDPIAPFIGEATLLGHLPLILRHPGLRVEVRWLPVIDPNEGPVRPDRRALAERSHAAIAAALGQVASTPASSAPRQQRASDDRRALAQRTQSR